MPQGHPYEILHCNYNVAFGPKMRFGHNFWLEGPIDLRPKRLNCILQDLFRDTPPDHIWRAQICAQMCQIWPNMHFLLVYKFEIWHETSFCPKELACQRLRLKSKKIETCYLYSVWICLLWQQGPYCLHEYCIRLEWSTICFLRRRRCMRGKILFLWEKNLVWSGGKKCMVP